MIELTLFLILMIHFFVQVFPRLKRPDNGIDLYRWLLYSRIIRSNSFRLPKYIDKYIIKAKFSYPPVLLYFMAIFSTKFLERYNFIISPLFSLIENLLLFIVTFHITNNEITAIIACLIYATTPANIIENMHLGTRSIGQLSYFLFIIGAYLYIFDGYSLIFMIIPSVVVLLTHRMSTQLMILTNIFMSIVLLDLYIFFSTIFAIVIAIIISSGHYINVMRGHISQINFYIMQLKDNTSGVFNFEPKIIAPIIGRNPYILLAIYFSVINSSTILDQAILNLFVFIFFIAILSTFVNLLRSVGEGHRYIAFTNPVCAFYLASNIEHDQYWLLLIFAALSLLPVLIKFRQLKKNKSKENHFFMTDNLKDFFTDYFKENRQLIKFMSFPPNLDDFMAYNFKNLHVMFHDNGFALWECYVVPFSTKIEKSVVDLIEKNEIDIFVSLYKYNLPSYKCSIIDNIYVYEKLESKNKNKT